MTPLVNIRCRPLGASLSRSACGQRYLAAIGPGRGQTAKLQSGACRGCELGPAHARGEAPATWADGAAVEEVVHVVAGSVLPVRSHRGPAVPAYVPRVRKLSAPVPKPKRAPRKPGSRPPGPSAKSYPHGDRMLTALEMSRLPEAVVCHETIRSRLSHGWNSERAITTPPQPGLGIEGQRFEWRGARLTVRELASVPEAASGLTPRMLRNRISRWHDLERAIATPVSTTHVERMSRGPRRAA